MSPSSPPSTGASLTAVIAIVAVEAGPVWIASATVTVITRSPAPAAP